MSRTRIFLSSTCYDLKAVREHIREKLQEFGHELLASEYNSFPVSPDLSTIENCKKVVRDHADLFILVVGGRRGSLDASGTRSVVNAEYLEAKARGIDAFIFVDRQVMDLLAVYQKNPSMDFSPTVDHPEVFKFITDLKSDARWIYTFDRTEDIISTLRTQLSIHLKTLIERGRVGSLIVPREYASEPQKAIAIIQERPRFWEFRLTCELLARGLQSAEERLKMLDDGIIFRKTESVSDQDAFARIQKTFPDMVRIISAIDPAMKYLMRAWGPPGQPGDPVTILKACRAIIDLVDALVEWEIDLRFVTISEDFQPLFKSLHGSTADILKQLTTIVPHIREVIAQAEANPGFHSSELLLKIESPATLAGFQRETQILLAKMGLPPARFD